MPYGIDFGFLKGAKMKDDLGLLTGDGKVMRILQQKDLDKKSIKYCLKQAIKINSKKINDIAIIQNVLDDCKYFYRFAN